jgi:deferrochelatase/peroxidase EfeB
VSKPGPQAGITNRPPEHLVLAAFDFLGADARASLNALALVVERELRSDLDPPNPPEAKDTPSAETGELGFLDGYDREHLTITLGVSIRGFEKLGIAAAERPQDLREIPWKDLVDAPPQSDFGDLVLQICADSLYICEHVVRRIEEELGKEFGLVSAVVGSQRYTSRAGRTSRQEGRSLIGFLDGTSNLDPRHSEEDAKLVFIDPANVGDYPDLPPLEPPAEQVEYGQQPGKGPHFPPGLPPKPTSEPAWTEDGTYMTVRVSKFETRAWDELAQNDQEASVGRFKVSGASLDLADEAADLDQAPAFVADQTDVKVPVTAHIRKANPRGGEADDKRRIFRRGYPLIGAGLGELQRGLIFIAFARTISTQFEFIVRGWIRNKDFPTPEAGIDPLLGKVDETVLGGGYYFVPPLEKKTEPWTWKLPAA